MIHSRCLLAKVVCTVCLCSVLMNIAFATESASRGQHLQDENNPTAAEKWSVGLALSIPDGLPVELRYRLLPYLDLSAFASLPIDFTVRVEYGRGVLASQSGLSIENPDLDVDFNGRYGPQYGLDLRFFPWHNRFFLSLGWGLRQLNLRGKLNSNVILTSSAGSIDTNTVIALDARAFVQQSVYRVQTGWHWRFDKSPFYLSLTVGLSGPVAASSTAEVQTRIYNPAATVFIPNAIIQQAESQFANDLQRQTKDAIEPFRAITLPQLSLSSGFHF